MYSLDHVVFEGLTSRLPVCSRAVSAAPSVSYGQVARRLSVPLPSDRNPTPQPEVPVTSELLTPDFRRLLVAAGIEPSRYRPSILNRRLRACLRKLSVTNSAAALARLKARPELRSTVVNTVLLGVSNFFRDPLVYQQLAGEVLPQLLGPDLKPLHVLSAGCSDGQELYSIAMLLAELRALGGSFLMGLDCREEALSRAALGLFEQAAAKDVPESCRHYLETRGDRVRVAPELAAHISWCKGDLAEFSPNGSWDVILYRNVAIYLEPATASEIWRRLGSPLRPGGILVTGKAERPPEHLPFERVGPCIYRKKGAL